MRKRAALLVLGGIFAALLGACGGASQTADGDLAEIETAPDGDVSEADLADRFEADKEAPEGEAEAENEAAEADSEPTETAENEGLDGERAPDGDAEAEAEGADNEAQVEAERGEAVEAEDGAEAESEVEATYGPAGTPFPIVGFGAGTLGGWQQGGDSYHVTTLADDGAGSLREGLNSGAVPRVILFDLDGTITLSSRLLIPSNTTLDGRGRQIIIAGKGFGIWDAKQVILVNLAIEDVFPDTEDAIQIGRSEYVVLDHLRLTQHGDLGNAKKVDEAISIVFGSRNITIAWCRVEAWEKVLLAGNGDAEAGVDGLIALTWHHSYAQNTGRRHPQARYGRFHLFNNFFDDWRMFGLGILSPYPESFGSQIQDNGRMLLEGQMVRRHPHSYDSLSTANDASRCESGGDLLEYGTWLDPSSTAPLRFGVGCAKAQAFIPPYTVNVETAGQALRDRVVAGAGNTL